MTRTLIATVLWLAVGTLGVAIWTSTPSTTSIDFGPREAAPSPSTGEIKSEEPMQLRHDPTALLNPAFRDEFSWNDGRRQFMDGVPLSAAGYPIIVVVKPVAVCADPFRLQLALDMIIARRTDSVAKIPSCILLPVGTEAEWTKPNAFGNGEVELRLPTISIPVTVYGPSAAGGDQPFFAWFGTLARQ